MKNINDSSDSRHQVFQLSGPAVEILLCRRDVLNDWQIGALLAALPSLEQYRSAPLP